VRRVFRRRLEQAREHGRFRQRHVAHRLAEVELRRRLNAERAAAHVGAIKIELQDLGLGEPPLKPQRQEDLAHLTVDGAFIAEEQVLGELLGDGGAALHHAGGARVHRQRARRADGIDAPVFIEAAVFGGENGLHNEIGKLAERNGIVVLDAAMARELAVAIEKGDGEVLLLQPVLGCLAEGERGEREHDRRAHGAQRGRLAGEFDRELARPRHAPAAQKGGVGLESLAHASAAFEKEGVRRRIEAEQPPLEAPRETGVLETFEHDLAPSPKSVSP